MSENWKIQVSPKLPDGTLVNVRAESAQEFNDLLRYVGDNAQLVADTVALLAGASNATPLTQPAASQAVPVQHYTPQPQPQQVLQFPQQQQAAAPAPVDAGAPERPADGYCAHGAYVWKDFTSKAGNHVKGWFCPSQTRTDCKPLFRK